MRLRKISDIETANRFLEEEFLAWFNQKYGREPIRKVNLHRQLTQQEKKQLPRILSRHSQRTVQNDFTFRFNKQWYQFSKEQPVTLRPKEEILLEEKIDDSFHVRLRGKYLNYQILPAKPERQTKQPWVIATTQKKERKYPRPPQDHPWRRFLIKPKPDISISLKP